MKKLKCQDCIWTRSHYNKKTSHMTTRVPHPSNGVYSPSVTINNEIVFVSGQLGSINAPENQSFTEECQAAMANLCKILKQSSSSFSLATMCTIYLTDINSYAAFNAVYQETLVAQNAQNEPPARACFGKVFILNLESVSQAAAYCIYSSIGTH